MNIDKKLKIIDSFIQKYEILDKFRTLKTIFNDEPKFYMSNTVLFSEMFLDKLRKNNYYFLPKNNSYGTSFGKFEKLSELKSKAEAIERFFLGTIEKNELVDFNQLDNIQKEMTKKYFGDFFEDKSFIEKTKLVKGFFKKNENHLESVFIPYQILYINQIEKFKTRFRFEQNSNGAAFGFTLDEALENALFEAIERDVVVNTFIAGIGVFEITNFSEEVRSIINYFNQYRLKIKVFQFQNHFDLNVVGVYIIDDYSDIYLSFGYKCGRNLNKTILGAIFEAFHSRIYTKTNYKSFKRFRKEKINELKDSIYFFSKKKNGHQLIKKINEIKNRTLKFKKKIKKEKKGLEFEYFYYIFNQSLSRKNFFVVKVIVPDFNRFFLNQEDMKKIYNFEKLKEYIDNNYYDFESKCDLLFKYKKIYNLPLI